MVHAVSILSKLSGKSKQTADTFCLHLPTPHMEWKVCCMDSGIFFISDDFRRAVVMMC